MDIEIRDYSEADYQRCSELVSESWNFDTVFRPAEFTELAKAIYTGGALIESTYKSVAVSNGELVGFIFGMNRADYRARLHLMYRWRILWRFFRLKQSSPNKSDLLHALSEHAKNRSTLVPKKRSEIALFVVAEAFQRRGVGTALWRGFLDDCVKAGEVEVFVETNRTEASAFYEKLGFQHRADFDSPLHRISTPDGTACIYVYPCTE